MRNYIDITQGFNGGSCFWFCPVLFRNGKGEEWKDWDTRTIEIDDFISIDEDDVSNYLRKTLEKHFDPNLRYNRYRDSNTYGQRQRFEWNLVYNYYTYESMYAILRELTQQAALLEKEDPHTYRHEDDYFNPYRAEPEAIADFYRRFCLYIARMLRRHPEADAFSIMGP